MTLSKLSSVKQSIIVYNVYKQDLVIWNHVSFSTNALTIAQWQTLGGGGDDEDFI